MNSYELANQLLPIPDVPVKLYTDRRQIISTLHQATLNSYSEGGDVSFGKSADGLEEEDYDDLIDIIELYGE